MKLADLSLDTIAGGAVPEKFSHQLRQVLDNILDPNTEATDKRVIEIKITLQPGEDRSKVTSHAEVRAKFAPLRGDSGLVYIGQRDDEPVAVTYDPEQADIFQEDADVRPLKHDRRGA